MKLAAKLCLIGLAVNADDVSGDKNNNNADGQAVEGSADAPNNCMNDAWEANAEGVCQPKAEYFALHCNADGMMVEMSPEVVPNALEVSIGSCSGSNNVDTGKWEVNSALDGCSTSLSTGEDGTLNFGNTLRAEAFNSNSIIFTSNAVNINLGCSYATHYDDIELTTTVVGSDVSTDTEGPEGKFSFELQMFNDEEMKNEIKDDDITKIGEPLYFKLSQKFPVDGVEFAIEDCVVKDENSEQEYSVIDGQCPDAFVNTQLSLPDRNSVTFSYTAFQFVGNSDITEAILLRLVCSAYVCNASDETSSCKLGCEARKRRSIDPSEKKYHVAMNMNMRK